MAKPRKPTMLNLRQGQTIYRVWERGWELRIRVETRVAVHYLWGKRAEREIVEGQVIERMPVSRVKRAIKLFGNSDLFFTRGRAERYAARRREEIEKSAVNWAEGDGHGR